MKAKPTIAEFRAAVCYVLDASNHLRIEPKLIGTASGARFDSEIMKVTGHNDAAFVLGWGALVNDDLASAMSAWPRVVRLRKAARAFMAARARSSHANP